MSPHYFQLRDGNTITVPETYRNSQYVARRFLVKTEMAESKP
ncbi:MAG TPA: hypothetical protein VMW38_07875 [Terriglobia bacterium]|nr:hypothetical protein [Terriglobia bacterium]